MLRLSQMHSQRKFALVHACYQNLFNSQRSLSKRSTFKLNRDAAFEERVAIHINEGGIPTEQAKDLAAQAQGFRNQAHYWAWLRVYVERKRLG